MSYFQEENYSGLREVPAGEYEDCTFTRCTLAEADLSGRVFVACQFVECDLSLAKIHDTAFREVQFQGCKLQGLHFQDANTFLLDMQFRHCQLNLASFYRCPLKGTLFTECSLHEVDFAEANLTQARFEACDLTAAVFDQTNLSKADLRSAEGYTIDPERNALKQARFSPEGLAGLLSKYQLRIG